MLLRRRAQFQKSHKLFSLASTQYVSADMQVSATSNEQRLRYDIILGSIGARYGSYCANLSRTLLVDPSKQQEAEYKCGGHAVQDPSSDVQTEKLPLHCSPGDEDDYAICLCMFPSAVHVGTTRGHGTSFRSGHTSGHLHCCEAFHVGATQEVNFAACLEAMTWDVCRALLAAQDAGIDNLRVGSVLSDVRAAIVQKLQVGCFSTLTVQFSICAFVLHRSIPTKQQCSA